MFKISYLAVDISASVFGGIVVKRAAEEAQAASNAIEVIDVSEHKPRPKGSGSLDPPEMVDRVIEPWLDDPLPDYDTEPVNDVRERMTARDGFGVLSNGALPPIRQLTAPGLAAGPPVEETL